MWRADGPRSFQWHRGPREARLSATRDPERCMTDGMLQCGGGSVAGGGVWSGAAGSGSAFRPAGVRRISISVVRAPGALN